MKEWKQSLLRVQEDGMEAIEGLLVITLMLFVLLYIWAYGFLLYQNWAVQYVATDTASRIAQTYAYPYSDPVTGFVSASIRAKLSPYRYQDGTIAQNNAARAERYAKYMLKNTVFSPEQNIKIRVETVHDNVAHQHIEVTVTAVCEIPFGFAMKYFGQSPYRTFTATGRAVCTDIKHYIYTIKTIDSFEDNIGLGIDSRFIKTIENSIKLIKDFGGWLNDKLF